MRNLHLLQYLAEAFRYHVNNCHCLHVLVELVLKWFVFRFIGVKIADMLVWPACVFDKITSIIGLVPIYHLRGLILTAADGQLY